MDISRDGIAVAISRDEITEDISRDGITEDISRDGITGYLKGWDNCGYRISSNRPRAYYLFQRSYWCAD